MESLDGVYDHQQPTGNELTVAPALLARLDWRGRVFTGDALFCQRSLCAQVLAAGGDYLLLVKANQPSLHTAISWLFEAPAGSAPPLPLLDRRAARTVESGHGRRRDTRHLIATTDLVGYSDWPGLAHVFRLERSWEVQGVRKQTGHYGVTSLPPEHGPPHRLLALKRDHWQIENRLHYVKDVTLGEDQSPIHAGQGPMVMSLVRDAALSLVYRAGRRRIASHLRYLADTPLEAVALEC